MKKPKDNDTKIAGLVRKFHARFGKQFAEAQQSKEQRKRISIEEINGWMWDDEIHPRPNSDNSLECAGFRSFRANTLASIRGYAESLTPQDEKHIGVPSFSFLPSRGSEDWVLQLTGARAKDGQRKANKMSKSLLRRGKKLHKEYDRLASDPRLTSEEKFASMATAIQAQTCFQFAGGVIRMGEEFVVALKTLSQPPLPGLLDQGRVDTE